jgi:hypothetical protein
MPREGEKGMEGEPLTRMEKKVVERRESTHLIQEPEKPKACRVCWIYFQLSLSKALEGLVL